MDRIRIRGGRPLHGKIAISGAKNAALPLMAASLLTEETLVLRNLPHLADIATMTHLLAQHGTELSMAGEHPGGGHMGHVLALRTHDVSSTEAPYDIVRKMRASVLVLGPLLARCGQARVSLPGGCAIGTRPVDMHIGGLEALGAKIELDDGYIVARAPQGLRGGVVVFPQVSVGATENLLMAATLAKGEVVLENAAREPEIGDLANCLNSMGARIEGIGSDTLDPGRRKAVGHRLRRAARSDRGGNLCHGRGHNRRRGRIVGRPVGVDGGRGGCPGPRQCAHAANRLRRSGQRRQRRFDWH